MLRSALLASAVLWACGQTVQHDPGAGPREASAGASTGGAAGTGEAGESSTTDDAGSAGTLGGSKGAVIGAGSFSAAGKSNSNTGGTGDVGTGGGTGGVVSGGGTSGVSPGGAGSGAFSGGDAAGAAGADAEFTRLCAISKADGDDPYHQSALIASAYWRILVTECGYAGLNCGVDIGTQATLLNSLRPYGPQLWHCDGLVARDFRLAYQGRTVNQKDGEALVDLYVTLTMRQLLLSDSDAAGLRKDLLDLLASSSVLVADAAPISFCSGGSCQSSGGAGGAGISGSAGASAGLGGSTSQGGTN